MSAPPPTAAATIAATATIATPTAAASPTASAVAVQPIADGTYLSAPIKVADIVALINAANLTAAQKTGMINGSTWITTGFAGKTTHTTRLTFTAGQFTQADSTDGGPFETGVDHATYAFPDDHTLLEQDTNGITTFAITVTKGGFSLKRMSAPTAGLFGPRPEDAVIAHLLFELSPFTLVP